MLIVNFVMGAHRARKEMGTYTAKFSWVLEPRTTHIVSVYGDWN